MDTVHSEQRKSLLTSQTSVPLCFKLSFHCLAKAYQIGNKLVTTEVSERFFFSPMETIRLCSKLHCSTKVGNQRWGVYFVGMEMKGERMSVFRNGACACAG